MKANITKYDPAGVVLESKDFYIPLIKKPKKGKSIKTDKDGMWVHIPYEPMRKSRCAITIGEFTYWVRPNGELDLIKKNLG